MKSSMNRFNSKLDTAKEIIDEPKDKSEKNCWGLSMKRKNMCMENADENKQDPGNTVRMSDIHLIRILAKKIKRINRGNTWIYNNLEHSRTYEIHQLITSQGLTNPKQDKYIF